MHFSFLYVAFKSSDDFIYVQVVHIGKDAVKWSESEVSANESSSESFLDDVDNRTDGFMK